MRHVGRGYWRARDLWTCGVCAKSKDKKTVKTQSAIWTGRADLERVSLVWITSGLDHSGTGLDRSAGPERIGLIWTGPAGLARPGVVQTGGGPDHFGPDPDRFNRSRSEIPLYIGYTDSQTPVGYHGH